MTILSPWALALAAALAIPALVLLYMLKLRRQPRQVSSTLLWRKSFEDLVANAPFQRLRWSLLLLLQLLAAAALALSLGRPVMPGEGAISGRVIVLIDRSASMNALDGDEAEGEAGLPGRWLRGAAAEEDRPPPKSRLDVAKERVHALIDRLGQDQLGTEMMLVAFARSPRLVSGFERSRARLHEAVDSIEPTDEEADLEAALELAEAFARQGEHALEGLPAVVVVTDGGVRDPERHQRFSVQASNASVIDVGPPSMQRAATTARSPAASAGASESSVASAPSNEGPASAGGDPLVNLGFAALAAERTYDNPAEITLFARLVNSGRAPVETVVTVRQDDVPVRRRAVIVPAATDEGLGEATLLETLEAPGRALLVVQHSHRDLLAADDVAAAVMPAPRRLRIALVSADGQADPFLREILEGAAPEHLEELSLERWERRAERGFRGGSNGGREGGDAPPDLVVFDRIAPAELPHIPSLTFGAAPGGWSTGPPPDGGRRVLGWRREHPLLRHVDLDELVYAGAGPFLLAEAQSDPRLAGAEGIVFAAEGPVAVTWSDRGVRHAAIAFELRRSNFPVLPAFAVFTLNALDYLAAAGAGQTSRVVRPGEPVSVLPAPDAAEIVVAGAGAPSERVPVREPGERVTLPELTRVGVRTVSGAAAPDDVIAVSMLSELESDLRPRPPLRVAASAPAGERVEVERDLELWPWVVLVALLLLALEWFVYLKRTTRPWKT